MLGKFFKAHLPAPGSELSDFVPADPRVSMGREFCQNGFVIVPRLFSREEISAFRKRSLDLLPENRPPYKNQFIDQAPFTEKLFRETIFRNERFISTFRDLLGEDFTFINEASLHDSFHSGWHTDTTSPEAKGGHEFHWSPEFLIINAAIYLQDNDGGGGGLDVVPGSYLRDDPYAITLRRENGFPPSHRIAEDPAAFSNNAVTLRAKAGDVVFFHFRTWHRSSIPTAPALDDERRKLALFLTAGRNNRLTRRYCIWLEEYAKMNGTSRVDPPAELKSLLSNLGLSIV